MLVARREISRALDLLVVEVLCRGKASVRAGAWRDLWNRLFSFAHEGIRGMLVGDGGDCGSDGAAKNWFDSHSSVVRGFDEEHENGESEVVDFEEWWPDVAFAFCRILEAVLPTVPQATFHAACTAVLAERAAEKSMSSSTCRLDILSLLDGDAWVLYRSCAAHWKAQTVQSVYEKTALTIPRDSDGLRSWLLKHAQSLSDELRASFTASASTTSTPPGAESRLSDAIESSGETTSSLGSLMKLAGGLAAGAVAGLR